MKSVTSHPILLSTLLLGIAGCASAADGDAVPDATDLTQMITGGSPTVALRYRADYLKYTSDNAADQNPATASTLRAAIGYQTKSMDGFSGYAEIYDVAVIGQSDLYNDTYNGVDRPTIVDPAGSGVNQAYVKWADKSKWDTTMLFGRQLFAMNDQVFVSPSLYRQNNDRNDGFSIDTHPGLKELEFQGAYFYRNTDVTNRSVQMNTYIANLAYSLDKIGRVAVYCMSLDFPRNNTVATQNVEYNSRTTLGARVDGPYKIDKDFAILYQGDIAQQKTGQNPQDIDAKYYMVDLGVSYQSYFLTGGYRHQSADTNGVAGTQFQSSQIGYPWPWRGNMEEFVFNPDVGLKTVMIWGGGNIPAVKALSFDLFFFTFKSVTDSINFGHEFSADLVYQMPWDKHWSVDATATHAVADDTDTQATYLGGNRFTAETNYTF